MDMTKEDLLKMAVYIQYPVRSGRGYKQYNIPGVAFLPLAEPDEMYKKLYGNDNHFTTAYHRKYSLPLMNDLLSFGYDENDFVIKERFSGDNDLSIQHPKGEHLYEIWGFNRNEHFDDLEYGDIVNGIITKANPTDYHRLYKYAHENSRIINKTLDNGRRLYISGDSQMIPDIGVLSCYFQEIWYMDNRRNLKLSDKWKDVRFTDVLVELNENVPGKYLDQNFI